MVLVKRMDGATSNLKAPAEVVIDDELLGKEGTVLLVSLLEELPKDFPAMALFNPGIYSHCIYA